MRHSNLKYDKLSDVLLFFSVAEFFRFCLFILFPIFASIALSLPIIPAEKPSTSLRMN